MADEVPSEGMSTIAKALLAGGAGAAGSGLLGAYLASRSRKKPGEDSASRRKRIIQNALMAAGLGGITGAGAVGTLDAFGGLKTKTTGADIARKVLQKIDSTVGTPLKGWGIAGGLAANKRLVAMPEAENIFQGLKAQLQDSNINMPLNAKALKAQSPEAITSFINKAVASGVNEKSLMKSLGDMGIKAPGTGLFPNSTRKLSDTVGMSSNIGKGKGVALAGAAALIQGMFQDAF